MLAIFQRVGFWICPNQLAKYCAIKSNIILYNSSCINHDVVFKRLVNNCHGRNLYDFIRPERSENLRKERGATQQQKTTAHRPINKDTEIYMYNWLPDKMTLASLPDIQGDAVSVCRQGLIKCNNGFSNIFHHPLELKNMQKILKQVFVEQKQSIRTISTRTNLALQKQDKKEKQLEQPPQNSKSDFANYSTDQLTRRQKLQRAVKEYGSTVMVFHVTISLISLGAFYAAISSGIDMVSIMSHFGVGDKIQQSQLAAGASTFVVAYAIHKAFAPVRIGITLSATPLIVRYLRLRGILKPYRPPK